MRSSKLERMRERERTDASLTEERQQTNAELERQAARLEEGIDAVVASARRRADEALARARATADEQLRSAGSISDEHASVATRRREDAALVSERSKADQDLALERDDRRIGVAKLISKERAQTDLDLLGERAQSDIALGSRDDVLAMTSHDLRGMLGTIAMSAASLTQVEADEPVRAAVQKHTERIRRSTVRMARLLDDLIDVASIEAGRLAVVLQLHDVAEVVRETEDVFKPIATEKTISLCAQVGEGSVVARFDRERIFQVLANLVGNALKFTPRGGRVGLAVARVGDAVRFTVSDTGPGIAPDELHLVFDRFWRSSKRDALGLGLGLYISKSIIEAHGGRIWAENQSGEGARISFTLPAMAASDDVR